MAKPKTKVLPLKPEMAPAPGNAPPEVDLHAYPMTAFQSKAFAAADENWRRAQAEYQRVVQDRADIVEEIVEELNAKWGTSYKVQDVTNVNVKKNAIQLSCPKGLLDAMGRPKPKKKEPESNGKGEEPKSRLPAEPATKE